MLGNFGVIVDELKELGARIKAKPDAMFGTVASVSGGTAQVVIDGDTAATPCRAECACGAGDRVTVMRRGVSCVAVSKAGGDAPATVTTTSTVSDVISPATGITVSTATAKQWGKVVSLLISAKGLSGSNTNISIGTVDANFRPDANVYGVVNSMLASHAIINSSGGLSFYFGSTAASSTSTYTCFITYLLP